LPEFAKHVQCEKWKTEVLDHLRMQEEERRRIRVCISPSKRLLTQLLCCATCADLFLLA
jgi:hypothetical protein